MSGPGRSIGYQQRHFPDCRHAGGRAPRAIAVGTFGFALDARLTELQVPSDIRLALKTEVPKLAEAQVPSHVQGEQRLVLKRALQESFVRSFRLAMLVSACGALASALCA
jgi:hypothetical protein